MKQSEPDTFLPEKQVVKNLAGKLSERYGSGWSFYKLQHCVRSAYTFSEDQIVYAPRILFSEDQIGYAARTQLTWTHLRSLMSIDDELKRSFYMEMCRLEHWERLLFFQKKSRRKR